MHPLLVVAIKLIFMATAELWLSYLYELFEELFNFDPFSLQ
jgi:hypothetical protein